MDRQRLGVSGFLAVLLTCMLVGCGKGASGGSTSPSSSTTVRTKAVFVPQSSDGGKEDSVNSEKSSDIEETLPDVSQQLPYKGMPAELIDATWLGVHEGEGDAISSGQKQGAIPVWWYARNGSGDRVFTAYLRNGAVIAVSKDNQGKNYWKLPDSIMLREFPDLEGTGEPVPSRPTFDPPDPDLCDDPDDYASMSEDYFAQWGAGDPYEDAYEYWLDAME